MHPTTQPASSDDIEIAALLRAVNRNKAWIAALALAAGVLTYVALSFVTPLYSSQARILIQQEEAAYRQPAASNMSSERGATLDEEAVTSQVQVLLSRDLAIAVVKDLKLDQDPEFNKNAGGGFSLRRLFSFSAKTGKSAGTALEDRVVDKFLSRLEVSQVKGSRVIAVTFQSQNPETAAKVANTLAEHYLTWQQGEKLKQTKEASTWLSGQIKELTKRVEEADMKAERFRSSTGLLEGRNNITLDTQQLSELNSQLILAKAKRTEAEARAALIQKMLEDKGDVAAAADVLNSRLIQRLLEQRVGVQRTLAELSATLLPSHPRIKELNSELADLRNQINQEARKVVSSLQNEAQIAGAREASLRESLKEMKLSAAKANENQIKLRAIEREAKANRDVLESYLSRYRDASSRQDRASVPAHASIISRAHAANKPSFPKKGPISLLTFAAVGILGLAYTVARELIMPEHGRNSGNQYARARYRPEPSPAPQPRTQANSPHAAPVVKSPLAMARRLEASGARNIIIAPALDGAGAAEQAIDMARAMASAGKSAILVDAMDQGDHIAITLDLPPVPGIHQLQSGEAVFEDSVRRDPESALHVISGSAEPDRAQGIDVQKFGHMLAALDTAYDIVIVYTAPGQVAAITRLPGQPPTTVVLVEDSADPGGDAEWLAGQIAAGSTNVTDVSILSHESNRMFAMPKLASFRRAAAV